MFRFVESIRIRIVVARNVAFVVAGVSNESGDIFSEVRMEHHLT
jgi:hypothetical protein